MIVSEVVMYSEVLVDIELKFTHLTMNANESRVIDDILTFIVDEPIIAFRRNVFCPLDVEKQVCIMA